MFKFAMIRVRIS